MHKSLLPFDKVPQLAKSDVAYATRDQRLRPFYQYAPTLETFSDIIRDRAQVDYPRAELVAV